MGALKVVGHKTGPLCKNGTDMLTTFFNTGDKADLPGQGTTLRFAARTDDANTG